MAAIWLQITWVQLCEFDFRFFITPWKTDAKQEIWYDFNLFGVAICDPDRKSYTYKYLYNLFIFFIIYIKHIFIC